MLFAFSNFLDPQIPYLVLCNISPNENKYRWYLIQVREEPGSFVLDLSRGRLSHLQRRKQEKFATKPQFLSFLKSTIAKRRRHGYQIVDMSFNFPLVKKLYEMNLDQMG